MDAADTVATGLIQMLAAVTILHCLDLKAQSLGVGQSLAFPSRLSLAPSPRSFPLFLAEAPQMRRRVPYTQFNPPRACPAPARPAAGISSFAVAYASKDILQNLLGGVVLLIFRPFSIGDMIQVKELKGKVLAISLYSTKIRDDDTVHIDVPNSTFLAPGANDCAAEGGGDSLVPGKAANRARGAGDDQGGLASELERSNS